MAFNYFNNALTKPQDNYGNGFSMKPKRNPFRGLTFEQEPHEQQTFAQNYPTIKPSVYEQFLERGAPKREDYQRSTGAKIGGALLSGLAGYLGDQGAIKNINNLMEQPYEHAMEDYQLEGGRLRELSNSENSRLKQEREIMQSIRDYELKVADDKRADLLAGNTLATGAATRENIKDQMRRRGFTQQVNKFTGELEYINLDTGERASLGKVTPSFGDENSEWDRRDTQNYKQQSTLQQRGLAGAFSNAQRLRQFDLDHPNPNNSTFSPSEQEKARDLAIEELTGPNSPYLPLFTEFENPNTGVRKKNLNRPEPQEAGWFNKGNAKDLEDWDNLYKQFEADLARKMNEILTKPKIGRFEITPVK